MTIIIALKMLFSLFCSVSGLMIGVLGLSSFYCARDIETEIVVSLLLISVTLFIVGGFIWV
jgi:hypothetical protein